MLTSTILATAIAATPITTTTYHTCALDTGCVAGSNITLKSDYAKLKYPLVLANGMFLGSNATWAWYGILEDLTANGTKVFSTKATQFQDSYIRGEQILKQVQDIIAITGSNKVNILGMSQGGFDARYVAGTNPQLIASITLVASPTTGSPAADNIKALSQIAPTVLTNMIAGFASNAGQLVNLLSNGTPDNVYSNQDSLAGMNAVSSAGAAIFNKQFPIGLPTTACGEGAAVVNGVPLFSWGGTAVLSNLLDPLDSLLLALPSLTFKGTANDGLVGQCSNHFGKVIRDNYFLNHFDEVNAAFGLVSPLSPNPISLYRQHANRLKNIGL